MRNTLLLGLCVLTACDSSQDSAAAVLEAASAVAEDPTGPWPPWTVRGRWDEPDQLRVEVDETGGPLAAGELRKAVARVLDVWNQTGLVHLREVTSIEEVSFVVRWGLAQPGRPSPFGSRPGFAFTGRVEPGTLVQLDPAIRWRDAGGGDDSNAPQLDSVIAHEVGHALGLGHTERREALLSPRGDLVASGPQAADSAGLASLYGPLDAPSFPGDLLILASGTSDAVAPALRGLATRARSGFALEDWDGDGDDELLVWRTDREGYGSLVLLDFGPGPRLRESFGPWSGLVLPGAPAGPVRARDGSLLFLVLRPEDGWLAYSLSRSEGLSGFEGPVLELANLPGDEDGDGVLDLSTPQARELFERGLQRRTGDLDGDGRLEEIRPIR